MTGCSGPAAPHTHTYTLNELDHPVVVYLEADNEGQPRWQIRITGQLMESPDTVRLLLLDLNTHCTNWFTTIYGTGHRRMTAGPGTPQDQP